MKNKSLLLIAILCILLTACKKNDTSVLNQSSSNFSNKTTCDATVADAETIQIFPADNWWNEDISSKPVDPYSSNILSHFSSAPVKTDFGSGNYHGSPIGIPFVVVCGSEDKITVKFRANGYDGNYGDESDKGPYAIPLTAPIEGNGNGDSHVISVDKDNGILYELYNASVNGDHWEASSGAIFNLNSNDLRHKGWTSADAAGLPIFPGLVRYDEVAGGVIDHAIRFTLSSPNVLPACIRPARHKVNSSGQPFESLPFGARIRLKANYDISSFSPHNQVILSAMKKYGLILADIGSDMFISGAPDSRWDNDELRELLQVTASDFEVVKFNK
jgi:major membrane immunogen (membrane-anchored lipoprotein)